MSKAAKEHSKFLSLVLRHDPASVGLTLDANGWVPVQDLLAALPFALDREGLEYLVADSDKQRFALSADGTQIRANQGHSVQVDLALTAVPPPDVLFHGTVAKFIPAIMAAGLHKGARHHVHLSATQDTARSVGARRGVPVILQVAAGAMAAAGHVFYCTENGVWLTDAVPAQFLQHPAA